MEFADHHSYSRGDVRRIIEAAREAGADTVLTTEKDLVNLRRAADGSGGVAKLFEPLRLLCLRIEQEVDPDLLKFITDALPEPAKTTRGSDVADGADAKAVPHAR
jgi:hypothetical protein